MNNTFTKRNSFEYLNDYEQIIDSIIGNERIEKLWNIYSNKYKYANGIDINEILNLLKNIIKEVKKELVAVQNYCNGDIKGNNTVCCFFINL